MKRLLKALLIGLVVFAFGTCAYVVDRAEFVYVTRLGAHVATYDGANPQEAGLHVGWPWPLETVVRLDRRLQRFELPSSELVTKSSQKNVDLENGPANVGDVDKTITIDGYVVWRIPSAKAADQFVRTFGSVERAEEYLRDKIRGDLGAEIPKMSLEDLHSPNATLVYRNRDQLRARLMQSHQSANAEERTTANYGIEVIDVRIRRTNHPPQVREAILARIISERNKKAAEYESTGQQLAAKIRTDSEATVQRLRDSVEAETKRIRGDAEAEADRIRNEAQMLDPDFYAELRRREIALTGFADNTTVWSTRLWKFLFPLSEPGKDVSPMKRQMKPDTNPGNPD